MTSIDSKMNSLNSDLHFLRSFQTENHLSKTLFFYHLPKTGGLSFFNTLALAKQIHSKLCRIQSSFGSPEGAMVRVDTQEQMKNTAKQLENNKAAKCEVIAGHVPFGTHKLCPRDTEVVTIIREPVSRVKSAYQYHCMRQQSAPSGEGFEEFMQQPEQQNVMAKQLGALSDGALASVQAKELVEQVLEAFDYVGDISMLKVFQEYYLSRLGLPCVAYERFNQTLPKYKINLESYNQQILEQNRLDVDFYQMLMARQSVPDITGLSSGPLRGITAAGYEVEKEKYSQQTGALMSTRYLLNRLEDTPSIFSDWPDAVKAIANQGPLEQTLS